VATVLVVEDDHALQALATKVLERAGHSVLVAGTGAEGVEAALAGAGDLMLLDLRLPGLDGWEVARLVKAARSTMPIVVCSANMMPADQERAREAGADAFLGKPYTPAALMEAVGRFVAAPAPAPEERPAPAAGQGWGETGAGRVLVVDDEAANRVLLRKYLTLDGFEVAEAAEGEAALQLMREWGPEAVLLDLMMPGMGGYDVLRVKATDAAIAGIPVLMLSAQTDTRVKVEGLELGAIDYLGKPFDRLELQARVRTAIRLQRDQVQLNRTNSELARQAASDALTGLANRREFDLQWERELARHRRHGTPLAVVMLDLDHFKAINDEFGHAVGDAVLRETGRVLRDAVRLSDLLARVGGEEFALVITSSDRPGAVATAEKLVGLVARVQVGPMAAPCTISAGVATTFDTPAGELLRAADRALYQAKRDGRNRVAVAGPAL
jgi:two-component system cell cycle response regulator